VKALEEFRSLQSFKTPENSYLVRLILCAGILIFIFLYKPQLLEGDGGFKLIICPFRNLTGLPCPGCGMTRGVHFIAHGYFLKGLSMNPFSPLFFIFIFLEMVNSLFGLFRKGRALFSWKRVFENKLVITISFIIVGSAVIYNIFRIWKVFSSSTPALYAFHDSIIYRVVSFFSSL